MNTKDVDLFIQDDLGVHLPNAKEPAKDALKTEVLRYMSKLVCRTRRIKNWKDIASTVDLKEREFYFLCSEFAMLGQYAMNAAYAPMKKLSLWRFWFKYHKNPEMWEELQNMLAKVKQFIAAQKG